MPDLPPLPEPVDPPVERSVTPPSSKAPAPGTFPRPVNVDATPVTPSPKALPESDSGFATTPRSNERPPGRPPAFRLLVPVQRADTTQSHYGAPPAAHPVEIPVTTASPTPVLAVEKRGPASIPLGQPLVYEIVVRNVGVMPAQQVRVEDEVPAGTRLLGAEPPAIVGVQGDRLSWVLDNLPPGAQRQFKVQVQPAAAGDWKGSASASVVISISNSMHINVMSPNLVMPVSPAMPASPAVPTNLTISLTGPERVAVGQTAVFQIRITNNGTQPLAGLVLRDRVPAGLQHAAGPELEADLGALEPGKTRSVTLTTKAVQPGRFGNDVIVAAADGQHAEAHATIQVMEAGRPQR